MTGYESKKAAAQAKLTQNAFDAWWDSNHNLNEINPCMYHSFEYWAWEGWHAALAQPAQRPWVGLTDDEYNQIWRQDLNNKDLMDLTIAKLMEKNNAT